MHIIIGNDKNLKTTSGQIGAKRNPNVYTECFWLFYPPILLRSCTLSVCPWGHTIIPTQRTYGRPVSDTSLRCYRPIDTNIQYLCVRVCVFKRPNAVIHQRICFRCNLRARQVGSGIREKRNTHIHVIKRSFITIFCLFFYLFYFFLSPTQ